MKVLRHYIRYPLNLLFVIEIWLNYYFVTAFYPLFGHSFYERSIKRLHKHYANKYFKRAIKYKGLLIKFGQMISCRPDVMPKEYIEVLSELQDKIPPVDYDQIKQRIESELNAPIHELFPEFSTEPIASASLGQVHEARMKNGEKVAVKVQYPGIDRVVSSDLKALRFALHLFSFYRKIDVKVLYEEFRRVLQGELNYVREARFAERFSELFGEDSRVVSPAIIKEMSTVTVLTMSFVKGVKINEFALSEKSMKRKQKIIERLVDVYCAQFFKYGFFHADPHPGNIFISDTDEIVFVDFGICSEFDNKTREGLRKITRATINYDVDAMVEASREMGIITADDDLNKTRELLTFAIEEYKDVTPREFKSNEMITQWVESVQDYLQQAKSFQVPHKILLFLRTLSILEGHLSVLDPDVNLIPLAKPMVKKYVSDDGMTKPFLEMAKDYLRTLSRLPSEMERFLKKINSGAIHVYTEDVMLTRFYSLLPSVFFGLTTIVSLIALPVVEYLKIPYMAPMFIVLAPVSFVLTIFTYLRAGKK